MWIYLFELCVNFKINNFAVPWFCFQVGILAAKNCFPTLTLDCVVTENARSFARSPFFLRCFHFFRFLCLNFSLLIHVFLFFTATRLSFQLLCFSFFFNFQLIELIGFFKFITPLFFIPYFVQMCRFWVFNVFSRSTFCLTFYHYF